MSELAFFLNIFYFNLVTLGKGLLMIPLIQGTYVETLRVLGSDEFLVAVAIGFITPGPANIYVVSVGMMLFGVLGAFLALFAVTVPSFVAIPLTSAYEALKTNQVLAGFFKGLTVAAIGLIFYSAFLLGTRSLTNINAWLVFALAVLLVQVFKVHQVVSVFVAACFGVFLYLLLG